MAAADRRRIARALCPAWSAVLDDQLDDLLDIDGIDAERAGKLLDAIVPSIQKTSELVQEIAAASSEQSSGVAQVGEAVTQMDQATQQNAALVEEMAAAASSLNSQAGELVQSVAVFKLA